MPHLRTPSYREHKASGQAVVELCGHTFYLGKYDTPESRAEYDRKVAQWLLDGRTLVRATAAGGPTVNQVMLAYVRFAQDNYRDPDGEPTREVEMMTLAFRPLKALYGECPAEDFGPLALKIVREKMIGDRLARTVINQRIGYVRRLFKWACSEQLIPPTVFHSLTCVPGLRYGRSRAKESVRAGPVPDAHVDAVVPYLPPTVRAMLQLQRITGMRSGELVRMRACEIEMGGAVWLYKPARHKTAYLGKERTVALGRQCQELISPFLRADVTARLFSPRQAAAERDAAKRASRRSKVQPSQVSRKKERPKRQPGESYDTRTYYQALRYGMNAAKRAGGLCVDEFWHPHQLRKSAARRIEREQGINAARAYLGHAKPDMTAHYAGIDTTLAVAVAERAG